MKPFNRLTKAVFDRFQTENMDVALSLIGDGLAKIGLRNQFCARLLGYRSFEAIQFAENQDGNAPLPFDFNEDYSQTDALVLEEPRVAIPDQERSPYPECADYLRDSKSVSITLKTNPLLLSLLPVLLDDRTNWHPHSIEICEHTFDVEAEKVRHNKNRTQIEALKLDPRHDGMEAPYAGLLEAVKLLSDTGCVPPELMGENTLRNELWINEHMKRSLEQLNATVKAAFDDHLKRIESIETKGLMYFTRRDLENGFVPAER